jgi:hypothetical protein
MYFVPPTNTQVDTGCTPGQLTIPNHRYLGVLANIALNFDECASRLGAAQRPERRGGVEAVASTGICKLKAKTGSIGIPTPTSAA